MLIWSQHLECSPPGSTHLTFLNGRVTAMKNMPIYEALAQAFAAEGVDAHFTLMGDGNMHWATAMKNLDGMATFRPST